MTNLPVNLTLVTTISNRDAKSLLGLTITDKGAIQKVGKKKVEGYSSEPFLDRMTELGLVETYVVAWGDEQVGYGLTKLGKKALKAIKQIKDQI